jgi:6-pyruvoyl tetrahydropterin synthase/QueD family protein
LTRDLLAKLAPRLKKLGEGGYSRTYLRRGSGAATSTHQLIADILDSLKIRYKENVHVVGAGPLTADFFVNGTWVFVDRTMGPREQKLLAGRKKNCVIISRDSYRSDRSDHGVRVLGLGEDGALQSIFLDDPSFNFDYAHILPKTQKCSVMHGHTSSALVELVGNPIEGMVVDFGVAKRIVKKAIAGLDHKLFINEKYVTRMDAKSVALRFETVHGEFAIQAPRDTTVLLRGEATVENLARVVLARISSEMPVNVKAVGVYVYEGLNKGSYLLAKIHQDGAEGQRKRQ